MKTLVALTLVAAVAWGGGGSIVSSFKSPGVVPMCNGIEAYGGYLYHVAQYNNWRRILKLTTTGSITSIIATPSPNSNDIDMYAGGAWVCATSPGMVYRLDTNFNVVSSFAAPESGGVAYDGAYVWLTTAPGLVKMTTSGSTVATVAVANFSPLGGLDVAGPYLWFGATAAGENHYIVKATTTGSVIANFGAMGLYSSGVSWDAGYIWEVRSSDGWVYKRTTNETAVAPASLGRVKALYH